MRRALIAVFATLAALPSAAQTPADSDGNGTYSMEELRAAFPGLSAQDFALADADGNGAIDPDELAAARAAGLIGG